MGNTVSSSTGRSFQDISNRKPNWLQLRKDTTKPKSKPVFISNQSLSDIQEMIIWRSKPDLIHQETEIPWTESHITAVLHYVLKLEGIGVSQFDAQRHMDEALAWGPKREPIHRKRMTKMFVSFTHDLRKFFDVPKLHELSSQNRNEILAAFIDFLLQLLYDRTTSMVSFADRIDCLEKELRFFVTVLGDTAFIGTAELGQVQNLLAEFEAVADYAGSLVHSLVFLSDRVFKSIRIDKELDALLKHIHLLKVNINKFSNLLPFIRNAAVMTPKTTVSVDSLFILDSLLYDLNDLMNREGGLIVDVKDQIEMLRQGLMISKSLLKGVKVPPTSEIQELKETVTRIRDVAYEAEYLISSFLSGNAPLWYLTVRLTDVIYKIKLIETMLLEIRKNYDIGALKIAEEFSVEQVSSQAKKGSEVDDIIVGLEDATTYILDQLVGGTEQLQIISIFGMPGLGKTTFTKKLYNHPLVDYRFDKRAWCVASQTYQRKRLLIDILTSSKSEADKNKILKLEEEDLLEGIYKSLKGRRYLIVIDDIWSSNVWDDLRRCFPDDGNGSRILFTSRNKDVAPPNTIINTLPSLSNDQCWELLEKKKGQHLISLQNQLTPFFGHHVRSFHAECPGSVFYLGSMKLIRVLDFKIVMNCSRLIGTEFLVNLRYLVINELPASISNLGNLEYLRVQRIVQGYTNIPMVILKMVKLRHLHVTLAAGFEEDCDSSHTNNIEVLSNVSICKLEDEEMLKCSPHLRKLKCGCRPLLVEENGISEYRYPDLRFLTQLQSLEMTEINFRSGKMPDSKFYKGKMAEINFPSIIKRLTLVAWRWPWEKMSIIGRLPSLEVLKLRENAFVGERWDTRDNEFEQLRFLKLGNLNLTQWNVTSSEHFPVLQRLVLYNCNNLREIPSEIGEIATLQLIEVQGTCRKSLVESARQIEQQQRESGNEGLRVIIRHINEPYD
ncbi:hypothetical protein DH2020_030383 [Rehmannia glutinosa]|uniref:Uncharacterized protein n=1 Tax=Rehmannia glutinosa TaxID=99300 RepID=A0ABR0VNX2_REHGL